MTAVISVVQASYVASTKYTSKLADKKVIYFIPFSFILMYWIFYGENFISAYSTVENEASWKKTSH